MADAAYYREYYQTHKEKRREDQRRTCLKPSVRAKKLKRLKLYWERNKAKINARIRQKHLLNPSKNRARDKLKYAVKVGKIGKEPCQVCKDTNAQAHHLDYSQPYNVRWLCRTHHSLVHRL